MSEEGTPVGGGLADGEFAELLQTASAMAPLLKGLLQKQNSVMPS